MVREPTKGTTPRGHAHADHRQQDRAPAHHPRRHGGPHLAVAARRGRGQRRRHRPHRRKRHGARRDGERGPQGAAGDRRRVRRERDGRGTQVPRAREGRHARGRRPHRRRARASPATSSAGARKPTCRSSRSSARRAWPSSPRSSAPSAVVVEGFEAGGHLGTDRYMRDLLPEIIEAVDIPVIGAGGVVTGSRHQGSARHGRRRRPDGLAVRRDRGVLGIRRRSSRCTSMPPTRTSSWSRARSGCPVARCARHSPTCSRRARSPTWGAAARASRSATRTTASSSDSSARSRATSRPA